MNTKLTQLLVLLVVCLLLVLGYFFVQPDRLKEQPSEKERGPLMSDFSPDAVHTVTLKRGDQTIELKKKDKAWTLPLNKNRAALASRVTEMLNALKDAKTTGSRSGKNLADFDLNPEKRTEVTLERETGKSTVYLGKAMGYGECCAQRTPEGPVLEVDKNLLDSVNVKEVNSVWKLDVSMFYDLKIFTDNIDDAIEVIIKKGNDITRVQKVIPGKGPVAPKQEIGKDEKPVWWLTEPEGAAADEGKVRNVISQILNLNAKDYADDVPEKETGFDKPAAKVAIRLKDGTERLVTFGKKVIMHGNEVKTIPFDAEVDAADKEKNSDPPVLMSVAGKADAYKVYKYVYETCVKTDELKAKEEKKEETPSTPPVTPPTTNQNPPPQIKPVPPVIPAPPPAKLPEKPATIPAPPEKKDIPPPEKK